MFLDFHSAYSRTDKDTFQLIVALPEKGSPLPLKLTRDWVSHHWLCDRVKKGNGPWAEMLGSLANLIRHARILHKTADGQFEAAAEIMARELFAAFQVPRILEHVCYSVEGVFKSNCWEIILPCGALAIVRGPAVPDEFIAAYYERKARDKKKKPVAKEDRWRLAARAVMKHTLGRLRNGDLSLLSGLHRRVDGNKPGKREIRAEYRFLCPENWGITWDDHGPYWDETLVPGWPGAAPVVPPVPAVRLVPR